MKKVPTAPKAALTKEQSSFSLTLKLYNNKKYDDLIRTFVYNIFENIQMTAKTEQHLCHEFKHCLEFNIIEPRKYWLYGL